MTTIPILHLNGTGRTTLRDEYAAAYDALLKAREAFASTTCNGRDFYPQGPDAYYKAREGLMVNFLKELWTLLNDYKFRGYSMDGKEMFAIPLSWLFLFFLLILAS
jgi:hypothetical protein